MKRFVTLFLCAFGLLLTFQSCIINYDRRITGNHQIVNKEIDIPDYNQISLSFPGKVVYRQLSQENPFLQVSTDENILPMLDIFVQNDRLFIREKENINLQPSQLIIYTNSRSLSKAAVVGSGTISLEKAVNAQEMEVSIAGSGHLHADSLYCESLEAKISGSGHIVLNGAANEAQFRISGSGAIRAFDYLVEYLDCRISGSGSLRVYANKELKASISGSGNIRYKGNPASVDCHTAGSGSIRSEE
jgi:hypothetical protein